MPQTDAEPIARRALDVPRLTLEDVAAVVGKSRASLDAYREGRVEMPEGVRLTLAQYLEAHARRLLELAEELRG